MKIPARLTNYINGKLQAPVNKKYFENPNPSTGKLLCKIPASNEKDVAQAVKAAEKAFPAWSKTSSSERFKILNRVAELILKNLDHLALAESMDSGKPLWLSKSVDIPRAHQNFQFFATAQMHFASESHHMPDEAINYTLRQPIGVVGCISPWNLPLYLFTWKIAPALATGNCVVAKPSEITPCSAYMLGKICMQAGLPAGVLNIIHGMGADTGQAIVVHPKVKAISFTGGTVTGARIASLAAPKFKKLSLELGGKNPNIIFADCDFDKMLKTTIGSSFGNNGQICLCGSRIYIEESIYDKFKKAFVKKVKSLKVGDPLAKDSNLGAISSMGHLEKILGHIKIAKEEGAKVLCGGKQIKLKGKYKNGAYLEPTVLEGLDHKCRTNQEEIFGPVVTLTPFKSEKKAIEMANSTNYGLSATVWTNDLNRAHRLGDQLVAGIVWVNCWLKRDLRTPFGGVKNSGVGREGGWEVLRFFTEPKNVCIAY